MRLVHFVHTAKLKTITLYRYKSICVLHSVIFRYFFVLFFFSISMYLYHDFLYFNFNCASSCECSTICSIVFESMPLEFGDKLPTLFQFILRLYAVFPASVVFILTFIEVASRSIFFVFCNSYFT